MAAGDAGAWPVWTIDGPGTDIALRNLTTGAYLATSQALVAGDQLVIDTRPDAKTATLNGTTNVYSTLDPQGSLWRLQPGDNDLQLEVGGATAATLITLTYRKAWQEI